MSFVKYASALVLATALSSGCAPGVADTDSKHNDLRQTGGTDPNSAQAFGGQIAGTTVTGLYYSTGMRASDGVSSATGWWLRTADDDLYAPVEQLTYNDENVALLTTTQGFLKVTTESGEYVVQGKGFNLTFAIGAPLDVQLRIVNADNADSYARYVTQWSTSGKGAWSSFCPHPYVSSDGVNTTQTEYMIPVGGAKWGFDGQRVADAAAIQLSCTHDMVGGCVNWGLGPWQSVAGQDGRTISLSDYHQACTRMKRNDICGSGEASTTLNQGAALHTVIWHWDTLNSGMAPQTKATMEAFWGVGGATCYNPSEFRSDDSVAIQRMQILLALCPKPTCSSGNYSGLLGSARPCLAVDKKNGNCIAN